MAYHRFDEPPNWRNVPASSSRVLASTNAVGSSVPPPLASADLAPNTGLKIEISDLTMYTASDPQWGSEPIRTADIEDHEEELVEGLGFRAPMEANSPFKRLRRVVEVSSPALTSLQPVAKGIVIHEHADFAPTEVSSSGKSKSHVKTWLSANFYPFS